MRISRQKRNDILVLFIRAVQKGVRFIPRWLGLTVFGWFGALFFKIPTKDRERTITQLRMIFGQQWTEQTIFSTAKQVYAELGRNFFDALFLGRLSAEKLNRYVTCDDLQAFRAAYDQGRGVIGICAHTGCFEMNLSYFAKAGFRCCAVGKELFDKRLDNLVTKARSGPNMIYLHRDDAGRELIRYLRQGMVFGTLIDQDTNVEGVFAPFLGLPAYTPSGPVKLAMKWDIPLFVVTTARQHDNSHHIFIKGPLSLTRSGDLQADLVGNVTKVNALIGETIMQFPRQWVWMHKRWARKPTSGSHA